MCADGDRLGWSPTPELPYCRITRPPNGVPQVLVDPWHTPLSPLSDEFARGPSGVIKLAAKGPCLMQACRGKTVERCSCPAEGVEKALSSIKSPEYNTFHGALGNVAYRSDRIDGGVAVYPLEVGRLPFNSVLI